MKFVTAVWICWKYLQLIYIAKIGIIKNNGKITRYIMEGVHVWL